MDSEDNKPIIATLDLSNDEAQKTWVLSESDDPKKKRKTVASFFSGQDSAPFDGAFFFTDNDEKNKRLLLLVDVVHDGKSKGKKDHHENKMKIFGDSNWKMHNKGKEVGFWSFGRALRETVNKVLNEGITLIAVDIAYEDLSLQAHDDPTQRTFSITSFAIGAATPNEVIPKDNIVDRKEGSEGKLPVGHLTALGFVEAPKEKDQPANEPPAGGSS